MFYFKLLGPLYSASNLMHEKIGLTKDILFFCSENRMKPYLDCKRNFKYGTLETLI